MISLNNGAMRAIFSCVRQRKCIRAQWGIHRSANVVVANGVVVRGVRNAPLGRGVEVVIVQGVLIKQMAPG